MRLKHLRLNGFKSFVDSTTILFPSNLTAIVGPNGCGKSNLIDAVRWVMGESSAKSLRGDSMIDVIFNGASERKPSGQASVELLFDNSMGGLEGNFGSYSEICVKRVVSRDANSAYYLNNQRCRRRDITDLFLGTGAGARSYSIISQGTISQLIEARPEELRAYFEEAAGVSKYKERRKETLSRIAHTRDNLQRINDICQELEVQINRLERQAKNALLYRALTKERRECQQALIAIKWESVEKQRTSVQQQLTKLNEDLYKYKTKKASLSNALSVQQQTQKDKQQQVHALQEKLYQQKTLIARSEEVLKQHQQQEESKERTLQQLRHDLQISAEQLQQDQQSLMLSNEHLQQALQERPALVETIQHTKKQLHKAKIIETQRLETRQKQQQELQHFMHQLELAGLKLERLEDKKNNLSQRLEDLARSNNKTELSAVLNHIQDLKHKIAAFDKTIQKEEKIYACLNQANLSLHQSQKKSAQDIAALDKPLQQQLRQKSILQADIHAKSTSQQCSEELRQWQRSKTALLSQLSMNDKKWQAPLEWILSEALMGHLLQTMDEVPWDKKLLSGSGISAFTARMTAQEVIPKDSLASKINGVLPHWPIALEDIYIADSIAEAKLRLQDLAPPCSVLTKEGVWIGHGWLKSMPHNKKTSSNLFAIQEQLCAVEKSLAAIEKEKSSISARYRAQTIAIDENRTQCHLLQAALNNNKATKKRFTQELEHYNAQLKTLHKTMAQHHEETQRLSKEISAIRIELQAQHTLYEKASLDKDKAQQTYEQVHSLDDAQLNSTTLQKYETQLHQIEQELHATDLHIETEKQKKQQWEHAIERTKSHSEQLHERMEEILSTNATRLPIITLKETLQQQQSTLNTTLQQLQCNQDALQQSMLDLDKMQSALHDIDAHINQQHQSFQAYQLQEKELAVRAQSFIEQLQAQACDLKQAQALKHDHWDSEFCETALQSLDTKIARLGAINLAAIDEFQSEKERRDSLQEEHQDVSAALLTLENAIATIDKETTLRLQDTFESVNRIFKQLFPKLFGGGKAELLLTQDNLLDAGIVIMAQPPGKRNSSLQLLSGGEKAMTAVALVFALFQLNPSPFCMLDEVDAPLDDANVGRFCELVKDMSSLIQFLFITHNKATMEMADQLIGVTMREPGVSKIVNVDLKEALLELN